MPSSVIPKSRILGTGHYTPAKVVSNVDLGEKVVDTSDAWIAERTGIRRRHIAADNEVTSDMATAAGAQRARGGGSQRRRSRHDHRRDRSAATRPCCPRAPCTFSTSSAPRTSRPSTSRRSMRRVFVYGIDHRGPVRHRHRHEAGCVLVIGGMSSSSRAFMNWQDRTTCVSSSATAPARSSSGRRRATQASSRRASSPTARSPARSTSPAADRRSRSPSTASSASGTKST